MTIDFSKVLTDLAGKPLMEGSLILPPGAYVAFYTSTASGAAGGAFSFQWEELPLLT